MSSFILDGVVAILLVATIFWCVQLHRRLSGMRRDQSELTQVIVELNKATTHAEASIAALKAHSAEAGAALQESVSKAQRLTDDLSYLTDHGSRLVDQLDGKTRPARQRAAAGGPGPGPLVTDASGTTEDKMSLDSLLAQATAGIDESAPQSEDRKQLEQELLEALRAAR